MSPRSASVMAIWSWTSAPLAGFRSRDVAATAFLVGPYLWECPHRARDAKHLLLIAADADIRPESVDA